MNSGRCRAVLLGCLITLFVLLGWVPVAATTAEPSPLARTSEPTTTPTADERDPWVRLDEIPDSLGPDSREAVTVTVFAGTDPIPAGWSVMLTIQPRTLASRTAVASWRSGSLEGAVGQEAARVRLTDRIPAGGRQRLIVPIEPAAKANLIDFSVWGVHGAAVLLLDDKNDTRRALTRTFMIAGTQPAIAEPPRVTVLLPITPSAISPDTGLAERTSLEEIAPGGRLDQLRELGTRPGVVPVIDPAVLTLTPDPQAAEPPAEDTTSGPVEEPLQQWRTRVRDSLGSHEVIGLPYADPDIVALHEAKATDLAALSNQLGSDTLTETGLTARQDIAVPTSGQADTGTIGLYSELGRNGGVVLDAAEQPTVRTSRVTPTARGEIEIDDREVPTLLTDPALSSALAATATSGPSSGAAARQRILADLVVLAGEAPSRKRNVLVTAPRGFEPTEHSVAAIDQLVNGEQTRAAGLTELLDSEPVDRLEPELTTAQSQAALPADGIHQIQDTLADASTLASTFTHVEAGTLRTNRVAVNLLSAQWRADLAAWDAARARFSRSVDDIRQSVRIVPGSTVTQVSRNVRLPVTVENVTDQSVAVQVNVKPGSNRLVVTKPVDVTVPPRSRATGYIPVRGVGNGDTSVQITLLTRSGVQLGEPVVTDVRVRADWETVGTRTIALIAAVVLFIGLVRSVRRGSRASRARDPQPTTNPGTGDTA